jgi:hypothetical protein
MRILRAMKADKTRTNRRKAVNLTLSAATIRKGNRLKTDLKRPSFSNVVEFLIEQAAVDVPGKCPKAPRRRTRALAE